MHYARMFGGAALALCLAAVSAGAQPPLPKLESGPAEKWLIDNAELILVTNFKQILGSDLLKNASKEELRELSRSNEQLKDVLDATGLDVTKDVDSVVAAPRRRAKTRGR